MKHTKKAGVVPFHSPNEQRYIIDKINIYYTDCLAQSFYTLRYTNYKNSLLLQKISHHYGIGMFDVIRMLKNAFTHSIYKWIKMGNLIDLTDRILNILNDNEATLAFLESSNLKIRPNHFVVIYRKGTNIMIRDAQMNARNESGDSNFTLFDYLENGNYYYLYLLNDETNQHTPLDGVKREHICDVFHCELYEEKDRLERKKHKQHTQKYKQYTQKLFKYANLEWNNDIPELIEPELSDPASKNDVQPLRSQNYENFNDVPKLIPSNANSVRGIFRPSWNNSVLIYNNSNANSFQKTPGWNAVKKTNWNSPVENSRGWNVENSRGWNAENSRGWNSRGWNSRGWNAENRRGWNNDQTKSFRP